MVNSSAAAINAPAAADNHLCAFPSSASLEGTAFVKKIIAALAVSLAVAGPAAAQFLPRMPSLGELGGTVACDTLMTRLDKDYGKTQSLQAVVRQITEASGPAQRNCRGDHGCELADAAKQCLGRWMQSRLAKGWTL